MKYFKLILVIICLSLITVQNTTAQQYGLGDIPLNIETYNKHLRKRSRNKPSLYTLPSSYDARSENIVTPAKDQGSCGSCWAFATVGAMESHLLKEGYSLDVFLDLSEQQLVSCDTTSFGCQGGYAKAAKYWETIGPIYESCFPYEESDTSLCSSSDSCEELRCRIYNWGAVLQTPNNFKNSLYEDGPGYWRFNVYGDFFSFWNSANYGDIYVQQSGRYRGGHAVLLIGWDDDKEAYLCKNSWGSGGPNGDGTFWIAYSNHDQNLNFGMFNFSIRINECQDDLEACQTKVANLQDDLAAANEIIANFKPIEDLKNFLNDLDNITDVGCFISSL